MPKSPKLSAISEHPKYSTKPYRGKIPRDQWDFLQKLHNAGAKPAEIIAKMKEEYGTAYSLNSIYSALNFIKKDVLATIDSAFIDSMKAQVAIDIGRIEQNYIKLEQQLNKCIEEGNFKTMPPMFAQMNALLKMKVSMLNSLRDNTKGQDNDTKDQDIEVLQEDLVSKLGGTDGSN